MALEDFLKRLKNPTSSFLFKFVKPDWGYNIFKAADIPENCNFECNLHFSQVIQSNSFVICINTGLAFSKNSSKFPEGRISSSLSGIKSN